jgi:hypothetical protein
MIPLSAHDIPTAAALPMTVPAVIPASIPVPAANREVEEPAMYNDTPAADVQLRNAEREFRARRMGLEEFRSIKKVLRGE